MHKEQARFMILVPIGKTDIKDQQKKRILLGFCLGTGLIQGLK